MSNIFKNFGELYNNESDEEFITVESRKNKKSKEEVIVEEKTEAIVDNENSEHYVLNKAELERFGFFKKFNSEYNLWYHHELNNWRVEGYRKIFHIKNIKEFWDLHNNIDCIGGITNQHFFLMKDNVLPIWEDTANRNGGSWSIKLNDISSALNVWLKLAMLMAGETIVKDEKHRVSKLVVGLSINLRNQNTCIIKIWNRDATYCSINLLNDDIIKEFGYNIIYKKNNVEY
jgi:hypothetical protein